MKSWEDLGVQAAGGLVACRKQFTVSSVPSGRRVFLEIGDVHDYARVKLNGKDLAAHAWQPYRWDITDAVKAGANDLEIEVRSSSGGRGGAGGGACAEEQVGEAAGPLRHIFMVRLAASEAVAREHRPFRVC